MDSVAETPLNPSLIFLHLIRTAGTTLEAIIRRQYGQSAVIEFSSIKDAQHKIEAMRQLPETECEHIEALMGLFNFGQCDELPAATAYITMLRDPVERIISDYHYILSRPEHELHQRLSENRMNLLDFVSSGIYPWLDNHQTRFLSGIKNLGYGKYSTEAVEMAKSNLEKYFTVLGLTERFDETAILLKRLYNWRTPYYIREKTNSSTLHPEELSPSDLELLREFSRMDLELYEFAQARFDQQMAQQEASFKTEVEVYQQMNRFCLPFLKHFEDMDTFDQAEVLLAADTVLNLFEENKLDTAEQVLQFSLCKFPDAPDLHNLRAVLKYRQGQVDEAQAMLSEFAARWPAHPGAHLHLGNIFKDVGDKGRSMKAYLQALRLDPNHRRTIIHCGQALTQFRKLQDARTLYSFYLKNNPRDEEVQCLLDNLSRTNSPRN